MQHKAGLLLLDTQLVEKIKDLHKYSHIRNTPPSNGDLQECI
jgi:hypothetical protein